MQEWYIDDGDTVSGPHPPAEMARRIRQGAPSLRVSLDRVTWLPAAAVTGLIGVDAPAQTLAAEPEVHYPGYAVEGVLGQGGMGTVYRARQLKLGRPVALKSVPLTGASAEQMARRFKQEAELLARLSHPNIVQVFDFDADARRAFFSMELLDGEDLHVRVARAGPVDERTAWHITRQAAAALAHAAALGIIHRDVKPANLFLVPAPAGLGLPPGVPLVKVMDFGLASTLRADERLTAAGAIMGTPAYMAPEQVKDARVDHRADIYGLGATTFHMLAGKAPFEGGVWDILGQKSKASPRLGPPVSEAAAALVAAMMEPDLGRRIQTYDQLLARIDGLPGLSAGTPTAPTPRRGWMIRLAAGVLIVGAGAAAWWLWPRGSPPTPVKVVSAGVAEQLYDGKTVLPWTPFGRPWTVELDDDRTPVLAGAGVVRRRFRPHGPDLRVTLGIDLHEATACEVALGDASASGPGQGLRITRQGASVGDGPAVPFPSAREMEGRAPYLEVQIIEAGGRRLYYFHGALVASLPGGGPLREAALWVKAEGGRVRIESAQHDEVRVER